MSLAAGRWRTASAVFLGVLIGVAGVGTVVALMVRAETRGFLRYAFPQSSLGLGGAARILSNNLGLVATPLGAATLLVLAEGNQWRPRRLIVAGDAVIGLLVCINVLVVGASLGAYGARMVRYTLPNGPVELAGFAVAISAYLDARGAALGWNRLIRLAAASACLLAVAALLEGLVAPI
jgi:hypothetical protein